MRRVLTTLVLIALAAGLLAASASAQDSQSLGDVARKARQQKQQNEAQSDKDAPAQPNASAKDTPAADVPVKDTQAKDTKPKEPTANSQPAKPAKRVITNDEIPEHIGPTSTNPDSSRPQNFTYPPPTGNSQGAAEQWKSQILAVKNYISSMQAQITNLEQSVHYAGGGNCISGCVQWNQRQKQKQEQIEVMKQQLEEQQKRLEQMQESARRQGFGSSVYDP